MRHHILISSLLLSICSSTAALAYDCSKQLYKYKAQVGMISPKKARKFIQDGDTSVQKGLANLHQGYSIQEIDEALELGLVFQSFGNESLIYNLDGLLSMKKGSALADRTELTLKRADSTYYYTLFQTIGGLRTIEVLKQLKRDKEVKLAEAYVEKTLDAIDAESSSIHNVNGNKLFGMRKYIGNTGKITSKKKSKALCEYILKNLK